MISRCSVEGYVKQAAIKLPYEVYHKIGSMRDVDDIERIFNAPRPAIDCLKALERAEEKLDDALYTLEDVSLILKMMKSYAYTYFLVSSDTGLVKIGQSRCIKDRVATIRGSAPFILDVKAAVMFTWQLEKALHKAFDDKRVHGEWFRYDDQLIEVAMAARVMKSSEFIEAMVESGILGEDLYQLSI